MKERPILFNGAMARAILEGRKTQTRRVVKCDYRLLESKSVRDWAERLAGNACYSRPITEDDIDKKANQLSGRLFPFLTEEAGVIGLSCPFGKPGDRLWVREAFLPDPDCDHDAWNDHHCSFFEWDGCGSVVRDIPKALQSTEHCIYREGWNGGELRWRPSIHMPRWASRITLEITDVRVERLQDISRGDSMAEGCPFPNMAAGDDPRKWFSGLWESINGASTCEANPWVWVVEFQRLEHSPT